MRIKGYLNDTVHYAFSSAFTMSPTVSANEGDRPEAAVVSDDEDSEEDEDQSLQEDTSFWYKPKNIEKPKIVTFTKDTKAPASEPQKPQTSFELGMNLILKDGKGNSIPVVYEGEASDGLSHTVRTKDGTKLSVQASHLAFLNQMDMGNIPSTPLDYCREVSIDITSEEAQRLARPRVLTPRQQELMSWHHRLHHLPFNLLFVLAKARFLPKSLLECQDKVPLCVACQFGKSHRRPLRTKGKKEVA